MCFAAFYVWNLKFTGYGFFLQMRRDVDGDDDDVKL